MYIQDLLYKIKHKWTKMRMRPVRIFCFHHVSSVYNEDYMNYEDWMSLKDFQRNVIHLRQNGVKFISLEEAYRHIAKDFFRFSRYAVLTFDDGYASLKEILPWLEEQKIPATLFINGKYLDGKSYRKNPQEKYLTKDELFALTSPLIEIGSHGWEHTNAAKMEDKEFQQSIVMNIELLQTHPRYIPFHAYTWGQRTIATNQILRSMGIIPVNTGSILNYNNEQYIDREIASNIAQTNV